MFTSLVVETAFEIIESKQGHLTTEREKTKALSEIHALAKLAYSLSNSTDINYFTKEGVKKPTDKNLDELLNKYTNFLKQQNATQSVFRDETIQQKFLIIYLIKAILGDIAPPSDTTLEDQAQKALNFLNDAVRLKTLQSNIVNEILYYVLAEKKSVTLPQKELEKNQTIQSHGQKKLILYLNCFDKQVHHLSNTNFYYFTLIQHRFLIIEYLKNINIVIDDTKDILSQLKDLKWLTEDHKKQIQNAFIDSIFEGHLENFTKADFFDSQSIYSLCSILFTGETLTENAQKLIIKKFDLLIQNKAFESILFNLLNSDEGKQIQHQFILKWLEKKKNPSQKTSKNIREIDIKSNQIKKSSDIQVEICRKNQEYQNEFFKFLNKNSPLDNPKFVKEACQKLSLFTYVGEKRSDLEQFKIKHLNNFLHYNKIIIELKLLADPYNKVIDRPSLLKKYDRAIKNFNQFKPKINHDDNKPKIDIYAIFPDLNKNTLVIEKLLNDSLAKMVILKDLETNIEGPLKDLHESTSHIYTAYYKKNTAIDAYLKKIEDIANDDVMNPKQGKMDKKTELDKRKSEAAKCLLSEIHDFNTTNIYPEDMRNDTTLSIISADDSKFFWHVLDTKRTLAQKTYLSLKNNLRNTLASDQKTIDIVRSYKGSVQDQITDLFRIIFVAGATFFLGCLPLCLGSSSLFTMQKSVRISEEIQENIDSADEIFKI